MVSYIEATLVLAVKKNGATDECFYTRAVSLREIRLWQITTFGSSHKGVKY
jgi:hypothetical protein